MTFKISNNLKNLSCIRILFKIYLGSSIPKRGMELVDERFHFFFQPQYVVYLISQLTLAHTMYHDQLGLAMSDCNIIPFFKFFELNVQNLRITQLLPVINQLFYMKVDHRAWRRQ